MSVCPGATCSGTDGPSQELLLLRSAQNLQNLRAGAFRETARALGGMGHGGGTRDDGGTGGGADQALETQRRSASLEPPRGQEQQGEHPQSEMEGTGCLELNLEQFPFWSSPVTVMLDASNECK